ncbi:hypothetical protein ASG12_07725 [Williamsia sp. Leaf354]|uniref:PD-(D/E)XK nuclease family protein n=1 Tax=Williamsia sp. Leaf354 TaxID=1736349 RepID=UPI0006F614BE|nr:PD-(D/E)XK nuclease family protein [Williamsia sp. Leaf354]KQS00740.1 hypothetical protein ASG12_07725 [Williamsia sp. Leaf354]
MADEIRSSVASLAEQISDEPLARIMFGGRELFHSNLLAWFCETMPARATAVFDDLLQRVGSPVSESARITVRREWQHMDLVIEWDGDERRPVVIENKVFSLPDVAQLDRYAIEIRKAPGWVDVDAVLLSLSDPQFDEQQYFSRGAKTSEQPVRWRHVSYGALGQAIATAIEAGGSDYATETIRHYAALVGNLHEMAALLEVSVDQNAPVYMNDVLQEATSDKQLVSSLSKLRARYVVTHIERALEAPSMKRWPSVGFSNGAPATEVSYALTNTKRSTIVGWQLQGAQLRLFAVLPSLAGRTAAARAKREQWGDSNPELFDFSEYESILQRGSLTSLPLKKPFNRFDPDFIYRYVDASDITVSQLTEVARLRQRHVEALGSQLADPEALQGNSPVEEAVPERLL